jgi:hypothetical protein
MNKAEARKLAKEKYGPTASAVSVSAIDRHQRFGIMFYRGGGALSDPMLGCLGHGDSFQAAWDHAEKNQIAMALAEEWKTISTVDYAEFGKDPVAYKKKHEEAILAAVEKLKGQTDNG